jgi:hypothetical protein
MADLRSSVVLGAVMAAGSYVALDMLEGGMPNLSTDDATNVKLKRAGAVGVLAVVADQGIRRLL